jgi:hypothetical protein
LIKEISSSNLSTAAVERVGLVISGDNAAAAVKTIVEAEAAGVR